MASNKPLPSGTIPYHLCFNPAPDILCWVLWIEWPDLHAALNLDPTDEYDGTRDDEICQMLVASGAPDWVEDPTDWDCDPVGWMAWGGEVTQDDVIRWALCHPELAGATDDEQGLRKRFGDWARSHPEQMLQKGGGFH